MLFLQLLFDINVTVGIKVYRKAKNSLSLSLARVSFVMFISYFLSFNIPGSALLRAHLLGPNGQSVRPRGKHHRVARRTLLVLELVQGACPVGPRRRWSGLRNGKCQWRCYRRPLHRRSESKWMKFLVGAPKVRGTSGFSSLGARLLIELRAPRTYWLGAAENWTNGIKRNSFAFAGNLRKPSSTATARKRCNEVASGSLGTGILQFRRGRQFRQRLRPPGRARIASAITESTTAPAKSVLRR